MSPQERERGREREKEKTRKYCVIINYSPKCKYLQFNHRTNSCYQGGGGGN